MPDRLVMPFGATEIRGTDGTKRTYRPGPGGTVVPRDATDARALRAHGAVLAGIANGAGGPGRTCQACGFRGFFHTCGRCGGECR
jgi:hypothetical protein